MFHNHQLNKPLSGPNGYKRLVRLVARAFYSGECPPKEAEEEAPQAFRSRLPKHGFPGLGVLVLDLLSAHEGYVDEEDICRALRLSQKNVRRALRYLEGEALLAYQDVKFKKPRARPGEAAATAAGKPGAAGGTAAAAGAAGKPAAAASKPKAEPGKAAAKGAVVPPEEEEEEQLFRKETRVFWCVDYPRLKDALRLRLHRVREFVKEQIQDKNPLQDYLCPVCGARYSSLDAIRLLDPMQGTFRCEECKGELVQHVEGGKSVGGVGEEAGRKATVAHYKALQARLEAQLKPIVDQLERVKDLDPPDYGSLQDWIAEQQAAAKRRESRERNAAARAKAAAAAGEEPTQEWLDNAEVQVNFGSSVGGATAAAEPGKELPAWFRTTQASGLASNTTTSDAAAAEPSTATGAAGATAAAAAAPAAAADAGLDSRHEFQEAYIQQYLADVARAKAALATGGGTALQDDKKDVKRIKTEAGWAAAGVKPEPGAPKAEPEQQQQQTAAADEFGWEDVAGQQAQQAQQAQQQQQQQLGLDEFGGEWEDVEAKQEGGGAAGPGLAAATAALDDDFEWEDA